MAVCTPGLQSNLAVQSCAATHCMCAGCVDENGYAYTWGYGAFWQLGSGKNADQAQPRQVGCAKLCHLHPSIHTNLCCADAAILCSHAFDKDIVFCSHQAIMNVSEVLFAFACHVRI